MEITCNGCGKTVKAFVVKQFIIKKNLPSSTMNHPVSPLISTLEIEIHRRGWFKSHCNRSGKRFRMKGTHMMEDQAKYDIYDLGHRIKRKNRKR